MDNNSMMTSYGDIAVETERQALDVINPGLMVFIVVVTVLMSLVGIPGNILIVAATRFEKASLFLLFGHLLDKEPPEILSKKLSQRAKAQATFELADSLFYNRKKEKATAALRSFIGDYNWSLIGPFKNVSGSGHIVNYPIEKEPFTANKIHVNEKKQELKWLARKLRNPEGNVSFGDYLLGSASGVYYANTFLNFPDNQTVQFRIARNTPMKIWLDDHLVFENEIY